MYDNSAGRFPLLQLAAASSPSRRPVQHHFLDVFRDRRSASVTYCIAVGSLRTAAGRAAFLFDVSDDFDETRPIPDPYVCIAVQSATQSKDWNNPVRWRDIVAFLKQSGYRVICIDQRATHIQGLIWNHIPNGRNGGKIAAGARALAKTRRFFHRSLQWTFMAQLGSRHSVVMISGFTHPTNEFHTPYRIINYHACNSCWDDPAHRFDHKD